MATTGMVDPTRVMEKVPPYATWNPNRSLANTLAFTGPTAGTNGAPSAAFTVGLLANAALQFDVTVTPVDSGTGNPGVFTPASIKLSDINRSATFTYTPGSTGVKVISLTNDGNLTNPSTISYTSS